MSRFARHLNVHALQYKEIPRSVRNGIGLQCRLLGFALIGGLMFALTFTVILGIVRSCACESLHALGGYQRF